MPRTPVRRPLLLAAVACMVLALVSNLGGQRDQPRNDYRARAESFAWGEAALLEQIAETLRAARSAEAAGPASRARADALRAEAEYLARLGAWHVRLEQKYMWAADHPDTPLPPGPPPPVDTPGR